jgi:hypothetical protein
MLESTALLPGEASYELGNEAGLGLAGAKNLGEFDVIMKM